jgi:hypothetical protein
VCSPAQVRRWCWHLGTTEGTVQQLALQPSPQPESSLPSIGQTFHLTVLSTLLSSHQLTLQIEKDVSQPKRSKERNSEGVNEFPCWSVSLFFKSSKNSAVHRQKSQASVEDSALESVTPTKGATEVACEEGVG